MAKLLFYAEGVRGRSIRLFDTKCEITTKPTVGSVLTKNALDGTKTIFYTDVVGVQFKKSDYAIGYLQLETPSSQMNNQTSNMFSENTFTFEHNVNGVTNELMEKVHKYIVNRLEEIKYGVSIIDEVPTFKPVKVKPQISDSFLQHSCDTTTNPTVTPVIADTTTWDKPVFCPNCNGDLSFMGWSKEQLSEEQCCPLCGTTILFSDIE